tara:strand:+ start:349 stop:726 length:378 start_codon:yes stop_codon:yes gene_type:complete
MQNKFKFTFNKDIYPHKAGHRGHRNSILSANETNKKLSRLKKQILIELYKNPKGLIGSELSSILKVSILTIRPRTTELKLLGLINDIEQDRKNDGGKPEAVFKLRSEILLKEHNIDVSDIKPSTK